jgi:outer membrane protein assembly factor BamB
MGLLQQLALPNAVKTIVTLLICLCLIRLSAADWPHWLGPKGNGVSTESGWKSEISDPIWKSKVGVGFSSVSVAQGRLFTMGHNGRKSGGSETVYCLDAKTGDNLWTDSYSAPLIDYLYEGGPSSTPTVDGETVYTLSKHGLLHAYQVKDGKNIWKKDMLSLSGMKKPPSWGFAASPLVFENLLIIEAGATYALDKKSGRVVWRSQKYRPAYGSPTIYNPTGKPMIAVIKTDGLVLLDAKNGKTLAFEKWETSYSTNASTPIVKGLDLFLSTGYRRGCALFRWTGKGLSKTYENKNLSTHMNHAILVGDYLYGFDGNVHMAGPKDFVCLRFSSGEEKWRVSDRGLKVGSLLVAGNRMILFGQSGELAFARVNPTKFEPIDREQVLGGKCWTMPVLSNDLLYLRNARGDLICLNLGK